jgi:hypothetical protein
METTFDYLRAHAVELGARILKTYPPLQSMKDSVAPRIGTLLRKALPAQALAITGTTTYFRNAKAARIVAECGAGKTYMALGTIHVLADGKPSTSLVMCPSHITHKWAREALTIVPRARTFLIEDMPVLSTKRFHPLGDPIAAALRARGSPVLEVTPENSLSICVGLELSDNQEDGVVMMRTYMWIGLAAVLGGFILWFWWYQHRRTWSTRKQDETMRRHVNRNYD